MSLPREGEALLARPESYTSKLLERYKQRRQPQSLRGKCVLYVSGVLAVAVVLLMLLMWFVVLADVPSLILRWVLFVLIVAAMYNILLETFPALWLRKALWCGSVVSVPQFMLDHCDRVAQAQTLVAYTLREDRYFWALKSAVRANRSLLREWRRGAMDVGGRQELEDYLRRAVEVAARKMELELLLITS